MTTRRRIDLLSRAYPKLFPRAELLRHVRTQLGQVDALEKWIQRDGSRVRAKAPKLIYHICAGNLAISAITSISHGLLLGAQNVVKLPGERDDSTVRREIADFIRGLPASLRALVETNSRLDSTLLRRADAVIAFGSDDTMQKIREQLRHDQKLIPHGHAVSLLWLADPNRLTASQARACAVDVLTYDQLGCLSPQGIYVPPGTDLDSLGQKLSRALEAHWQKLDQKPARSLAVAARIAEARDVAHALGHRVWLPPKKHLGWTLIFDPSPTFEPSPLHGVIFLRRVSEAKLSAALAPVAGRISTVGVSGSLSPRAESAFLSLGITRFCPAGKMQFPPLAWHHDGRSTLADLVTWIDSEVAS